MPNERLSFNPTPPHRSLESLKQTYKQKLDAILYSPLTVDNIETFADEALDETVQLTEDVLTEYRKNPNVDPRPTTLDTKAEENEAFKILELPDIQEILESIIKVKEHIDGLKEYLELGVEKTDTVITPPNEGAVHIAPGSRNFKEKQLLPRLLTLLYVIEHDFEIPPKNTTIIEGATTKDMMRKTPYVRVEIPDLNRIVYICDEEGNASYVFDAKKLAEKGLKLDDIDVEDKEDKNALIASHLGVGMRIVQSKNWREKVAEALGKSIPEKQIAEEEEHEGEEKRTSEFKQKKEWPTFKDFQKEVRALYPGQGDVNKWYRIEKSNHPNWPSQPNDMYAEKGWGGWPELVGIENRFKKNYLLFEDFISEVRSLYPGQGDVKRWYRIEKSNHPSWPSQPHNMYAEKGWDGWPELVGIENRFKKNYLLFEDFISEVRALYPGQVDVQRWYIFEKQNHPNWPSQPYNMYAEKGWDGWPELVGKKRRKNKPVK